MSRVPYTYTLDELWSQYVQKKQPKGFPLVSKTKKLKYSNALLCMTRNMLHNQRGVSPVILWVPSGNVFNSDIQPRESLKTDTHRSIFDRYGHKAGNGEQLKVTSHQMRHLLNTIAQRGGLSNQELAKWSGRADPNQNRVYNHMSEYEMVAQVEELDETKELFGPVGTTKMHVPISIQEFNTLEKGPVHITEFGVCVHDYTMSPCDKYRDCLNCSEQVCIKGEVGKLEKIKARLMEVAQQADAAQEALNDGLAGADRWYEYHQNTRKHLTQLVEILESQDVPDGSQIKLINDKSFSTLNRALNSKLSEPNKIQEEEKSLLKDMVGLMGGGLG